MILALKLFLTPVLIAAVSLAGRRWGPGVSGWLIGFPLTSGPVSVILALQHGNDFAARAAIGNLGGLASIGAFCLAYSGLAHKRPWWVCVAIAALAFLLATAIWNVFTLSLLPTFVIALIINGLVIGLIPRRLAATVLFQPPRWDLPARMIVAATFVVLLTTFASILGPQLSGLLTPFPVFGAVLAVFAHRQQGAAAAMRFLRGHAISLFGFAAFFLVVGGTLPRLGGLGAYALATLAAVVVNGLSLRLAREPDLPPESAA